MKKFLILFLMFVATPAMANTANIACGDSKDCNDKSVAAQKCTDLGYSLNKVENCEHYLKCPFDKDYQKCVKYPKISCQSLGFTKTTACNSNQKQLTCTDSDGSVKYQCLDEKSAENCEAKGFTLSTGVQWGCDKLLSCQEGGKTYKLCAEGHVVTSYTKDSCGVPCDEGEDSEYDDCTDTNGDVGCVWGTDTSGNVRHEVIVHSSVFNKSNRPYDCDDYGCPSGACYTFVESKADAIDSDCLCSPCGDTDFGQSPNYYYCDCDATFGSVGSGTATTDVCKSQGLYANMDGTFTPTKQGNSFGKVYFVSSYKSHFFFDAMPYSHNETCSNNGCYAKVVALDTTTVTLKHDNYYEDRCLANVAKVTEDEYCLEHDMSLSRDCRIITKNTGSNVVTNILKINPNSEEKFAHDYNYEIYSWLGNSLGYLTNYDPGFGKGHWYVPTILETKKSGVGGDITSSVECETGQFFATSQDDSNTGNFRLTNSGLIYPHLIIYSDGCPVQQSYETLNAEKWPPQN